MKFTKLGKALTMSALSAGLILGVTSCVQSYTVGYLYVTGTITAQSGNNGIISGFRIDHNTGYLLPIHQFPISTGGTNPVRAVLLPGSRFLYVLNRGVNAQGNTNCSGITGDTVCQNASITQFAVGGNGILTFQQQFYTQGFNPFRLMADTTGGFLLALDHDAPDPAACKLALNVTSCGDVTVFKIDPTTGRLSLVTNAQVTSASGSPLTYFPVPANPIDFVMASSNVLTLSGTPASGDSVFPYTYSASTGQLTLNQNTSQVLSGVHQATAIVNAGGSIYVLDNEAPSPNPNSAVSQMLVYTVGTGGALQAQTSGIVPDDPTLANPVWVLQESKSKFVYLANAAGNPAVPTNPSGGIAGYNVTTSPTFQLNPTTPSYFGTGAGPQCIVEDPSDQYIYTANILDSTVTGRIVDPNSGVLNTLTRGSKFTLAGPPTWCLVDGRTD
jgi:6-phosphogluconolactonase (cycloisomerase 2 family)